MDYDQLFAQFILVVFAILVMYILNNPQRLVEEGYKKTERKLEKLKEKASKVEDKNVVVYKKVKLERRTHHHRSIIASALKRTLEEEIGKLVDISESIRSVKDKQRNPTDSQTQVKTLFAQSDMKDLSVTGLERESMWPEGCKTNTSGSYLQPILSKPSMFSTNKRFKQYSIYHCRVYLNNGITPVKIN